MGIPRRHHAPYAPKLTTHSLSSQIAADDDDDDKENAPTHSSQHLPNPKKRAKTTTTATANTKATRTASRKVVMPSVLSPKSHNSRQLPRSPFKPNIAQAGRPASPVKPSLHAQYLAPPTQAAARAPSRQAKRGAADTDGRSSGASTTSAGTTIVTKPVAKRAPALKVPAKATTAGRKPAGAAKKENLPPVVPAAGGRTLRKRG